MMAATAPGLEARLEIVARVPDTPVLVLDARVMRRNISNMAEAARAAGRALRPHAKTHKMLEVARLQLMAGAVGLQVAKLGEAEALLASGLRDVLVGYPVVGAAKVTRLLDLAERVHVSVSLDDVAVAEPIARAARERGLTIPVLLEIDTGLERVGVVPGAAAQSAARLADLPGLQLAGIMTHEGQALGRSATYAELEAETRAACQGMRDAADAIRTAGLPCPVVSVGSTATLRFDLTEPGVTEVRPGTYVFHDATQVAHGAADLVEVALWVVATVVSRASPERAVVDAGSKVLSSDRLNRRGGPPIFGHVADRPDHVLVRLSEEHGVVATPPDSPLRVGDRVAIVPSHVCPVVNLAEEVLVAEGPRLVDHWRVAARGRVR